MDANASSDSRTAGSTTTENFAPSNLACDDSSTNTEAAPELICVRAGDLPSRFNIQTTWHNPGYGFVLERTAKTVTVNIIGHQFVLSNHARVRIISEAR